VFVTASEALYWQRWEHISESVEMWLDRTRLDELSHAFGGPSNVRFEYRDLIDDPVIAGVAARFRSAMFAPEPWDPMRIEALGEFLAVHFLETYHGIKGVRGDRIRKLEPEVFRRVTEYIAAHLDGPMTLRTLAQLAGQSPFHFAKSFRITTAVPPYTFVTARRMDRAMTLLRTTPLPVRDVAVRVGYVSLSHFLRNFRSAWGQNPHDFRGDPRG
jgi:AraC family transcriptional regulator